MKKLIFIPAFVLCYSCSFAQLQLTKGIHWQSDTNAVVVLNNLDFQNNATSALFSNTFRFNGNANTSISGDSVSCFRKMILDKNGNGKLMLQQNITLSNSLYFSSGTADLNGFNCYMDDTALLLNENEYSHVEGSMGGYIQITQTLNNPANANPGNLGAALSSAQNMGSTIIRRGHQQINVNGASPSINRYFEIIPANNAALNATLQFHYLNTELASANETDLNMYKSSNFTNWSYQGITSIDTQQNIAILTGIPDFSVWTLADSMTPLALSYLRLNANCLSGRVSLRWTVQSGEQGNFAIEHSDNGTEWAMIEKLPYTADSAVMHFSYENEKLPQGYYRVAFQSIDNRHYYSGIAKVNCEAAPSCDVYPNPTAGMLYISLNSADAAVCRFAITDGKGAVIQRQSHPLTKGRNLMAASIEGVAAGAYYLAITLDNGMDYSYKIIKK